MSDAVQFRLWEEDGRVRDRLAHLACDPPQALLLEGGSEARRLHAAQYWAMALNCPHAARKQEFAHPCGECSSCRQIAGNEHSDMRILDGRISNTQDAEKPGAIRALNMENARDLKVWANGAPRGNGLRVAIILGMMPTREEALNGLLKTLEEPSPHTRFVLLAPQREQILPTLVSRSMCLTLPWQRGNASQTGLEEELAVFLKTGAGRFMEQVTARGALDDAGAVRLLVACQQALLNVSLRKPNTALGNAFAPLADSPEDWAVASAWLSEALGMLHGGVAPARVLLALQSRIFLLLHRPS